MDYPKKLHIPKTLVVALVTLVLIAVAVVLFLQYAMPVFREWPGFTGTRPNTAVVDFHTHNSLDPSVTQIVMDGEWLRNENPPIIEFRDEGEPEVYLRFEFLRDNIDPFVFFDQGAGILFFSTLYEMLEFTPVLRGNPEFTLAFGGDGGHYIVNGSPRPLDTPVIYYEGGIYVPAGVVGRLYPIIIEYREAYNIVVITTAFDAQMTAVITEQQADIRYFDDIRSPILQQIDYGETVTLFPGGGELGDFIFVRTQDGILGYVETLHIGQTREEIPATSRPLLRTHINNNVHPPRVWQGEGQINLLWDAISQPSANAIHMDWPIHESVNVISPTWFNINDEGTHLDVIASREYVDRAHAQGVEVWPLVFDVWYTQSRQFLTSRDARQRAVQQLVYYAELFNFDGINIDFEHLRPEEGRYKIQFLRELAIPMRQRGITLSAAVKVPRPYNMFYHRDLIGKTVDFVMVMAYDEHWLTSPVAGPNASLPFVRDGVAGMLREVPNDRLILALPFYNRVWQEVVATGEVSHFMARGTYPTREFFEERGVQWEWLPDYGLYFGMVTSVEDGETVIFRVWLECARSIQQKMNVFYNNNLAGVASWSRIFAIDEFWEVIGRYF